MMDVWLLFNLMYPFLVVLMHTYMDTLRDDKNEEKEEKRTQKHEVADKNRKREKKLQFWQRVSILHSPVFVLAFMVVYWVAGLRHADII